MKLESYLRDCQQRVNNFLDEVLPSSQREPCRLHQAMRYAVLNGGKRIRAAFVYATGEALGGEKTALDACSAAVELVHAFSIIHDDLPAIDNDDLRRGQPACHKAFDEATAILAGDALLALSFKVLAFQDPAVISPNMTLQMIQGFCHYVGSYGMAGGESLDVETKNKIVSLKRLSLIYKLKTGYLLCASILLGALSANCQNAAMISQLEKFALYLGLAYQIHDDIIGMEEPTAQIGKPQNSDSFNRKPTYPQIVGMAEAKLKEQYYFRLALSHLEKIDIKKRQLVALANFTLKRRY